MKSRPRILIAGIGGASLGTEILKCLVEVDRYDVYGCDISEYAYGHYQEGFVETFVVKREKYCESVLELCTRYGIQAVIPGGEEPLMLLGPLFEEFKMFNIQIATNSPDVIATCSDKRRLFERLQELGFPVPWTIAVTDVDQFREHENVPYPCVIKPSTGTGGSRLVFLATDQEEAILYLKYVLKYTKSALVQEYIPLDEGEFTIGVLSLPNGDLVGSIAMKRLFHAKLSVLINTKDGLISSGYSQGLIDEFPSVCAQAEAIARALRSTGPMNIQARLREHVLIPFEINPRFSASTYLRAMAGFNEVDMYLRYILFGEVPVAPQIRPGYYLRSLSEVRVDKEMVKR
jgi:carbamoyl-phosphate synthase large subunit